MTSYAKAAKVLSVSAVKAIDALLVVCGFTATYAVRTYLDRPDGLRSMIDILPDTTVPLLAAPLGAYWWIILLCMVYWPVLLDQQQFYRHPLHLSMQNAFWISFRSALIMLVAVLAMLFLMQIRWANRTYLVGAIVVTTGMILARQRLHGAWVRRLMSTSVFRGYPLLIAAHSSEAPLLVRWLNAHPEDNIYPAAIILTDPSDPKPTALEGVPVMGNLEKLVQTLHDISAASVLIGTAQIPMDMVSQIVTACEIEGVDAWLPASFVKTRRAQAVTDSLCGRPALLFTTTTAAGARAIKRLVDILGSMLALVFFTPLMAAVAVLIKITSPGPVLFRQKRSGLHGQPFVMYKFRSMTSDAEMRKAELDAFNEMSGPVFKITQDPRVTPLGRFLRRWSLDELPQLFNVLYGHMSLVGPRPLPVYEVQNFNDLAHRRRLSMKPGLTCLWQIRGRNKVRSFEDWVRLDLEYIDNWSLSLDFRILLETPFAVLRGTGC